MNFKSGHCGHENIKFLQVIFLLKRITFDVEWVHQNKTCQSQTFSSTNYSKTKTLIQGFTITTQNCHSHRN